MTVTNWSCRYRTREHRRFCTRPGCGAPAVAMLRFQPTQREALLVDIDDDGPAPAATCANGTPMRSTCRGAGS